MDRAVVVEIRDQLDNPLPDSSLEVWVNGAMFATFENTEGHATVTLEDGDAAVQLIAHYPGQRSQQADLAPGIDYWVFHFSVYGGFSNVTRNILTACVALIVILAVLMGALWIGVLTGLTSVVIGLILVGVSFYLAFSTKDPTSLQEQLIRSAFALGIGGLAAGVPGLLDIHLQPIAQAGVTASGAIAAYIITFFFVPARY